MTTQVDMSSPHDWNTAPLLDFLELQRGVDLPLQDRKPGSVPIIGSNGIVGYHDAAVSNGPGVITGRSGSIGKLFYVDGPYWPLNTSLYVKNFKGNDPKFILFKLENLNLARHATGTGVPTLNRNVVHKELVRLPTIAEQKKIATVLVMNVEKIQNITSKIAATQALKQSLMRMLFKHGSGTKNNHDSQLPCFAPISFGKIAPIIRRPVDVVSSATYPELGLRSFGKGTFHKPALTGEAVGGKRLFAIEPGDLLFSNVFAWEGAVAVVKPEDKGRFGSHRFISCNVDKSRANAWYLYRYFTTPDGIAQLQLASPGGAGRNKTLGLAALAAINIPLPPLAEQEKIVAIMDAVDAKLAILSKKQALYQTLKRGLMQKLLSGEWRVKCDDVTAAQ